MSRADLSSLNAGYVAEMLESYLDAPGSVPDEWRELFEHDPGAVSGLCRVLPAFCDRTDGAAPTAAIRRAAVAPRAARQRSVPGRGAPNAQRQGRAGRGAPGGRTPRPVVPSSGLSRVAATRADETLLGGVAAAMALVKAYRMHGHLAARLDPLGSEPIGDPALDESRLVPALTPALQARLPASLLRLYVEGETLLEALPLLRDVYTGSMAYEIEYISDHAERVWLRQAIESGRFRQPLDPRSDARFCAACPRRRGSSSISAGRSSGRSSSPSKGSRRSCPCSTRRSHSPPKVGRTRW